MAPTSITGAAAIGQALDNISASTVNRLIKNGDLRATKLPGRGPTSPWRVERKELARFRQLMRRDGADGE